MATAVQNLMTILRGHGLSPEWYDMGGNNMVVRLVFGVSEERPYGASCINITDREQCFDNNDRASDDNVWGFFARAYVLDADGEEDDDDDAKGWLYTTPDDAGVSAFQAEDGDKVVCLPAETHFVVGAVLQAIADGEVNGIPLLHNGTVATHDVGAEARRQSMLG